METLAMAELATVDSTVDIVIDAIKLGIRDARFAPGQRLVETELMSELNVSRPSVREALRRLTAEGLVQCQRFRGASVMRMSRSQAAELGEIRATLEGLAAALAARKLTKAGEERLVRLQKQGRAAASGQAYHAYNEAFHALIWSLSGNRELPRFVEYTRLAIFRLQFASVLLSPRPMERSLADHERVASAILDHNPLRAEREMRTHIDHSMQGILDAPSHFFTPE
jgi:DNA-binding GntR family transcriptional regulator